MNFKFENFSDFELIKKKVKIEGKAKVVNLIIFFPLTSKPCITGCNKINDAKIIM